MAIEILPQINASGSFTLNDPLSSYVSPDIFYTVIAIRKIEEIEMLGIDVFDTYYKPINLSDTDFNRDHNGNISIITLKSSSGELKHIPSYYLKSFPSGNGVVYSVVALAVELGALPVDFDLSHLENKVKELTISEIGVTPRIRTLTLSNQEVITQTTHDRIEAARKAKKATSPVNTYKQIADLTKINNDLKNKVKALESFILNFYEESKRQAVYVYADGFED